MADPQTPVATVTVGDQTHEVPLDALQLPEKYGLYGPDKAPEGYVTNDWMQAELTRRTQGMVKKESLLEDDDFFKTAASKRGIQLDEGLKPVARLDPEQVKQQRQQWEAEALRPVQQQLEQAVQAAANARQGLLLRDVMQAASDAGVKADRLKSLFGDGPSEFVKEIASRFRYDEERGAFFFNDAAGNPVFAENPTPENPYAGPKKLIEQLRGQDKDNTYFEDRRQRGSGAGGFDGRSGLQGGVYRISRVDARDADKYRQARAAAEKAGVRLEIVD